MERIVIFATPS